MSAIERAASSPFSRSSRELTRLGQSVEVAVAHRFAAAEIECTALDAIQQVASRAMQGVALGTQLEQQLATVVPEAEARLRAIGDIHAVASAEIVLRASRRMG